MQGYLLGGLPAPAVAGRRAIVETAPQDFEAPPQALETDAAAAALMRLARERPLGALLPIGSRQAAANAIRGSPEAARNRSPPSTGGRRALTV
jgi:hypothetical protein